MRELVLLGSTGSIGTKAIDIIRRNPDRFRVVALGAGGGKAAGPRRGLERLDTVEKEQPSHNTLRKTDARAR